MQNFWNFFSTTPPPLSPPVTRTNTHSLQMSIQIEFQVGGGGEEKSVELLISYHGKFTN